ncbi:hypothetical protein P7K49_021712 [Saguinus oedipus]|uniref:Sn1-specific diacylglycerol lipase alpha n=1 Tax=Saguinus oedipus TaxID=9490 RepID=A0ABQ9UTE7_SAGOE|nr:hypothetical protein P7K49_021712 [Saguinus oedipus]
MPGIVVFRRRWSVGSDDLVLPAIFLFLLHTTWFVILSVVLFGLVYSPHEPCSLNLVDHGRGYLGILLSCMIAEMAIIWLSMRGGILYTEPRDSMQYVLYVRLAILVIEFIYAIVGIVWLTQYYNSCNDLTAKNVTLEWARQRRVPSASTYCPPLLPTGMVVCNWVVILSVCITVLCVFDPTGRTFVKLRATKRRQRNLRTYNLRHRLEEGQATSWSRRLKVFLCCTRTKDSQSADSKVPSTEATRKPRVAPAHQRPLVSRRVSNPVEESPRGYLVGGEHPLGSLWGGLRGLGCRQARQRAESRPLANGGWGSYVAGMPISLGMQAELGLLSASGEKADAYSEIAYLFAEFFRDLDIVPSDIIAGLVLLRQRQRAKRNAVLDEQRDRSHAAPQPPRALLHLGGHLLPRAPPAFLSLSFSQAFRDHFCRDFPGPVWLPLGLALEGLLTAGLVAAVSSRASLLHDRSAPHIPTNTPTPANNDILAFLSGMPVTRNTKYLDLKNSHVTGKGAASTVLGEPSPAPSTAQAGTTAGSREEQALPWDANG